jgi:hypothetical protein
MYIEEKTSLDKKLLMVGAELAKLEYEKSEMLRRRREIEGRADSSEERQPGCVLPCPKNLCNGLIMRNHICGICETKVCKDCNEIILEDEKEEKEHKCDPEKVETTNLIKSTTRACPKCGVRIHKSEGCNQVFCTQCHVAFDYRTGRIETGRIHNPHYFEYLRSISSDGQIRREVGDLPNGCCINDNCGLIDYWHLNGTLKNYPRSVSNKYTELYRLMIHIERVEKPKFAAHLDTGNTRQLKERDLRVRYMQNKIKKDCFEKTLRMRQKKIEKSEEVYPILDMVIRVVNDILLSIPYKYYHKDLDLVNLNIAKLVEISNESLKKAENTLKIKLFRFTPNLEIIRQEPKKVEAEAAAEAVAEAVKV